MLKRLTEGVYDYFKKFYHRYRAAPYRDQGLIVGAFLGALYAGVRSLSIETSLMVPMVGVVTTTSSTRFILASVLGGTAGSNIGDQLGQSVDVWRSDKEMNNEIFLMRLLPTLFLIAGISVTYAYKLYEGKPVFASIEELSKFEILIFTILSFASLGRTAGFRGGRILDLITNNVLVSDFGLFRLCKHVDREQPDEKQGYTPVIKIMGVT
jgi:MFS family permease